MPSRAACSAVLALATAIGCRGSRPSETGMAVTTSGAQVETKAPSQGPARAAEVQRVTSDSRRTALVAAAERASAAVVSINVTSHQEAPPRSPWDFFFVPEGARVVQGLRDRLRDPSRRRHPHQPACGRQCGEGGRDPRRRQRSAGQGPRRGSADRHRRAQDRPAGTPPVVRRSKHRPDDRRVGRRARQSVRLPARQRRADRHRRRGERHRPQHPARAATRPGSTST